MKHPHSGLIAMVLSLCTTAAGFAATFATEADYNSLIKTGNVNVTRYASTGGIGDGESIRVGSKADNNSSVAQYLTSADRLSSTSPITLSVNFQWSTPDSSGIGGQSLMLGFGSNANGATLTPYTGAYTEPTKGSLSEEIYIGLNSGGPGSNSVWLAGGTVSEDPPKNTKLPGLSAATATLVNGGWYFFTATFTPNESLTKFDISYSLYNVNATTGELIGAALLGDTASVTYSGVFDDSVNPFLSMRMSSWSGVSRLDNLTFIGAAIPEPSTIAALVGGGVLLAGIRLRRRQKALA